MSDSVSLTRHDDVAVITINSPPVNALSLAVRSGLQDSFAQALASDASAIVLICAGRTFIAGADISEFGKPPADPWLPEVLADIEASKVPVVAAIHGTALGGGLETAMACHYRIAVPSARLGLPEVLLGLLPGAGGTQWAPRLVGIESALDMMVSGKPINAAAALERGLIDRIAEGDLLQEALAYAAERVQKLAGSAPRRSSGLAVKSDHLPADFFAQTRAAVARKTKNLPAPQRIIDCVEAAATRPIEEALEVERSLFTKLMNSSESAGLRHMFFAERMAAKVDGVERDTPLRPVNSVGIIGAGLMGGGIAMNFANAGIPSTLLELDQDALDRGLAAIRKNYERSAAKGRFTTEQVEQFMSLISGTTEYADLADVDLVIEAVFEDPGIKAEVFRKLDDVCKPGAILASNTSYQNIDDIAAATNRPEDVIGMHFFSPANIMKLLEVVRAEKTADDVLATVMKLAKKIRKVAVVARVGYGFIGNRMFDKYVGAGLNLLLEGVTPSRLDGVMEQFGMAMGPIAVIDMAGLDIAYKARKARGIKATHPADIIVDNLVEDNRCGQKTGAGFYNYNPETRARIDEPEVESMIRSVAESHGIAKGEFSDQEIIDRVIAPMVAEGHKVLDEGIAQRASDIDVVFIYGYGFPAHRGGPMFYASQQEK